MWVDLVRYGPVPESGELRLKKVPAGKRTIRVRLKGQREVTQPVILTAGEVRTIRLPLTTPATAAELHYQAAEELREGGQHKAAIEEYHQAIKLRGGRYPAARVGLARSLMAEEQYEEASEQAERGAREFPGPYPEAHTVIANIKRAQGLYDEAIISYRKALAQARDYSFEAHTGLALTYQEQNRVEEALRHLRIAAEQSADTEPVIYFLLGNLLERQMRRREAIAAYERYLQLEPQGRNAAMVRSVLKQLQKESQ